MLSRFLALSCGARKLLVLHAVPLLMLGGCAALPTNGPTVGQLEQSVKTQRVGVDAQIVPLDAAALSALKPVDSVRNSGFAALDQAGEPYLAEVVRPSDVLTVTIYEVGVSLFGSQSSASAQTGVPSAGAQTLSGVRVDERGVIRLPYIGALAVVGFTPREIAGMIELRLRSMSQSPQAVVVITDSVEGSVNLLGAVTRNGRYRLSVARERLRDMIAVAGGVTTEPEDAVVRITRNGKVAEMRLGDIQTASADDLFLMPGDRIEVLRRPRSFTVFGASDRISQIPFGGDSVSLSEAIARAGGPSDPRANPRGIFVFRLENTGEGQAPRPVIYRIDLMEAGSYFIAQQFAMRDKDLIYMANSASNPPTKFIGIINQLFAPAVTIRALTK